MEVENVDLAGVLPSVSRHPWEEEPNWGEVLDRLGLEAIELLVDLESAAEDLWLQALATMESELELDPGLSVDHEICLERGPWGWLRSTPLYLSLELELSDVSADDSLAGDESPSSVLGPR